MVSQHAGEWIFVAAFCVVAFVVTVLVALAPVKERQIRLLVGMGIGTGLLAIAYLVLVSLLPGATAEVPHTGIWAPEVVQSIAPTLGVVTVGSLSVWVALLTTERTRLSAFDWSEAEIFGITRTALTAIDAAVEPFHQFLSTAAAVAGWDMLVSAWKGSNMGPRRLGYRTPLYSTALGELFTAERRQMLARAAQSAEVALGSLAAAQARIGRPLQLTDDGSMKLASLEGDVALLRDVLLWAGKLRDDTNQSRLVFMLARAASTSQDTGGSHTPSAAADPELMRRVSSSWLPDLLDRLERFRPPFALPPRIEPDETEDLHLVADRWDSMERSRFARATLIARLNTLDPAHSPSRPFSAPTHGRLWSQVIDGWRSDMQVLSDAGPEPEWQTRPCITYQAVLPVADVLFTLTAPASDSDLTEQAKAAGIPSSLLLAGRVSVLDSSTRQLDSSILKDRDQDEVFPVELDVVAVDYYAQWRAASLVARDIGEDPKSESPLGRSLKAASRETPQETLWQSPLPLPQVRWWVGLYAGFYKRRDDERRRELRVPEVDESGTNVGGEHET
jgi:hypothetical protein